jgi:phosphohistidine phosphatase
VRSLLMLRHAKSDWHIDYGGEDLQRPLARRGRKAATAVGRFLTLSGQVPNLALSSPALRARQTLTRALREARSECPIEVHKGLYGSVDDVLEVIARFGGEADVLLIVGHEPTWSSVASLLSGGSQFRLPTGSVLRLDFETSSWTELPHTGRVQWLVTPRLLRDISRAP